VPDAISLMMRFASTWTVGITEFELSSKPLDSGFLAFGFTHYLINRYQYMASNKRDSGFSAGRVRLPHP
jgi:hypothetical protein